MANHTKFTKEKRAEFVQHIRDAGNVSAAARAIGLSRRHMYGVRDVDDEFREEWDAAFDEFMDTVEAEIHRRAATGYLEPVFYQGQEVAKVRKYSDNLLMFYTKAKRPEFRDRLGIDADLKGPLQILSVNFAGIDQKQDPDSGANA